MSQGDKVDDNEDDDEDLSPWQSHINRAIGTISSTREHGDTEGLDSEVCCSVEKYK